MSFGQKLKQLRTARGKSQTKVIEEISNQFVDFSISQTYLSTLENSERAPRQEILEIFAEYYDVALSYFFASEEKTKSADVHNYIEALRQFTPDSDKRFAHSTKFREDNDEIQQDLDDMNLMDTD